MLMPVTLVPCRARLGTSPNETGSPALTKTIGIVDVAAFAASPEWIPPTAAITATRTLDEVGRKGRQSIVLEIRPAKLDRYIPAFDVPGVFEPLAEGGGDVFSL